MVHAVRALFSWLVGCVGRWLTVLGFGMGIRTVHAWSMQGRLSVLLQVRCSVVASGLGAGADAWMRCVA